jgi:mxaJ protein
MSSASRVLVAALLVATACAVAVVARDRGVPSGPALRVCADPNNLPYSNDKAEGFENALAQIVARDLGRRVQYTWWPQRRGFIRTTLRAGVCDVVMGVPTAFDLTRNTHPYYRSTYVFVTRRASGLHLDSIDDPRLQTLSIGVPLPGDDYANVPPADALVARHVVTNLHGYAITGDYSHPNPPAELIDAVARGDVDVAVAWGPLAGFFAARAATPLEVTPIRPSRDPGMRFDISLGVRRNDIKLERRLDEVLARHRPEIDALLARYHVPRVGGPSAEDSRGGTQ